MPTGDFISSEGLTDFLIDMFGALDIIAFSLAVGGIAWALVVLRVTRGIQKEEEPAVIWCLKLVFSGAVALAAGRVLQLVIQAFALSRALGESPFPEFFHTRQFEAGLYQALIAAGLCAAVIWLGRQPAARGRWVSIIGVVILLIITAAWLTHGASRPEDRAQLMILTTVHQTAAAIWVGGVAQFVTLWRLQRRWPQLEALWSIALKRFFALGVSGVLVLVGTGVGLGWFYIGSWLGLFGTAYGIVVTMKMVLFALALGLAGLNFLATRRWARSGSATALRTRVPYFIEAETILLLALLFAGASLSSQAPAVDTQSESATWSEIIEVFTPRMPQLTSPSHAEVLAVDSNPLAQRGNMRTAGDVWSEFNHDVAGLALVVMGLLALVERTGRAPLLRHWPLGFVVLAVFLFFRSNPWVWPLGPVSFWEGLLDAESLQHDIAILLVFILGIIEWHARVSPATESRLPYVFPILSFSGGILLLTHSHQIFELKTVFLIYISHASAALMAVLLGCGRWLELRLGPNVAIGRMAGLGAITAMVLMGIVLAFYHEPF